MRRTIDFYWDIGSTNTYFALHLLRRLAARHEVPIVYHPLNLGYVFRHHNYVLMEEPKAKLKNRRIDLMRWAERYDLPFRMPKEFPIKTSRVLRGALVMRRLGLEEQYMDHVFSRYWEQGDASIQHYDGLAQTVVALGQEPADFAAQAESEDIRAEAIRITGEALDAGVFGAPTMRLDGELYWGKDRFEFIEDHLVRLASHQPGG